MILVRDQSWGKFHVVANRDDHAAACGRTASTPGAFSRALAVGNDDLAIREGWVCQHCLNRLTYSREAVVV